LLHEVTGVEKDVSLMGRWLKESMEATEMKEEQELDTRIKGRRKVQVFEMYAPSLGISENVSFFLFL